MKKQLDPTIAAIVLAVAVVIVVGFVYMRSKGPGFQAETTGSEDMMSKVKSGQPLYQAPANAPVPPMGR
jgi:uncharacterized protein with FMN-binding domain